jgi:hypothetical protein
LSDQIFNAPEAEVMVKKATNNELWGPSGTEMSKIADLTHHFTEYRQIMDALWSRLSEKTEGRNWRQLYKVQCFRCSDIIIPFSFLESAPDGLSAEEWL